jgi:hypothetical protein
MIINEGDMIYSFAHHHQLSKGANLLDAKISRRKKYAEGPVLRHDSVTATLLRAWEWNCPTSYIEFLTR